MDADAPQPACLNPPLATSGPRAARADGAPTGVDPATDPSPDLAMGTARSAFAEAEHAGVYAWLWWLSGSRDVAADLTQEAFAAFWSSLDRIRVREPRVWLYRIARNRWRKWCRDRRGAPDETSTRVSALVDPVDGAVRAEATRRLVEAVAELPRAYREAITLRYWSDVAYRDIARVLGVTAALARWRVHRGQRLLRERLGHDWESPPGGAA